MHKCLGNLTLLPATSTLIYLSLSPNANKGKSSRYPVSLLWSFSPDKDTSLPAHSEVHCLGICVLSIHVHKFNIHHLRVTSTIIHYNLSLGDGTSSTGRIGRICLLKHNYNPGMHATLWTCQSANEHLPHSRPQLDSVHVLRPPLTDYLSCPGTVGLPLQGEQRYKGCSLHVW